MTWRHGVGGGEREVWAQGQRSGQGLGSGAEGSAEGLKPVGRQDSYHDVVMPEQPQLGQVHCRCGWAQREWGVTKTGRRGGQWRRGQGLGSSSRAIE